MDSQVGLSTMTMPLLLNFFSPYPACLMISHWLTENDEQHFLYMILADGLVWKMLCTWVGLVMPFLEHLPKTTPC